MIRLFFFSLSLVYVCLFLLSRVASFDRLTNSLTLWFFSLCFSFHFFADDHRFMFFIFNQCASRKERKKSFECAFCSVALCVVSMHLRSFFFLLTSFFLIFLHFLISYLFWCIFFFFSRPSHFRLPTIHWLQCICWRFMREKCA